MEHSEFINIVNKKIQNAIINELYKNDFIDFFQYNKITKKLEGDIIKLESKFNTESNNETITFSVPIYR